MSEHSLNIFRSLKRKAWFCFVAPLTVLVLLVLLILNDIIHIKQGDQLFTMSPEILLGLIVFTIMLILSSTGAIADAGKLREEVRMEISKLSSFTKQLATQETVDELLARRAVLLAHACEAESRSLRLRAEPSLQPKEEEELRSLASAVAINKEIFWNLHGAAQKVGFSVKARFSQYLPEKKKAA